MPKLKPRIKAKLDAKKRLPQPEPKPEPKPLPSKDLAATSESKDRFHSPLDLANCVAGAFGKRGSGKTELLNWIVFGKSNIKAFPKHKGFDRVLVYDPRYQMTEGTIVESIESLVEEIGKSPQKFRIVYRPRDVRGEFPLLCRYVRDTPFDSTLFYIDEISIVVEPKAVPLEFFDIIRTGRHDRIGVVMTAQRPTDVDKDLTSQCNHLFMFHQHEPRDVDYFSGIMMGRGKEILPNLEDHSFVYTDTVKKLIVVDKNLKICDNSQS